MLSYETPRNLGLSLNLQNTTSQSQTSSDAEQHEHDETIDENTKLLEIERQDYVSTKLNGNRIKSDKTNYATNITNNNLCNLSLVSSNLQNNNSISKRSESKLIEDEEEDSVNENSVNNNDDNSDKIVGDGTEGKKIIKMTKLGSKSVTLKR
jgi:hypothetical protein